VADAPAADAEASNADDATEEASAGAGAEPEEGAAGEGDAATEE